jgi:hypothetical protein
MSIILDGSGPITGATTIGSPTATTLTTTTLNAPSGVLATQNGMTGIAKAWVQFAGETGTVNSSFNVSSVTRNASGQYTINYTIALSSVNYSVVGVLNQTSITFGSNATPVIVNGANTTTTSVIYSGYTSSTGILTANDYTAIGVAVFAS